MLKREMEEHIHELHMQIDQDTIRLERIWELHQSANGDYCAHCMFSYPCPTVQAFYVCDCCGVED